MDIFCVLLTVMERAETTPEVNTSQCIFYPVKEEEREVLLGASRTNSGDLTTGTSSNALQTELQATDSNLGESLPFPASDIPLLRKIKGKPLF